MSKKESLGPLELAGRTFHTAGTVVKVVDNSVTQAGQVLEHTMSSFSTLTSTGAKAIELASEGWLEDMQIDALTSTAQRKVDLAIALKEANETLRKAGIEETISLDSLKK